MRRVWLLALAALLIMSMAAYAQPKHQNFHVYVKVMPFMMVPPGPIVVGPAIHTNIGSWQQLWVPKFPMLWSNQSFRVYVQMQQLWREERDMNNIGKGRYDLLDTEYFMNIALNDGTFPDPDDISWGTGDPGNPLKMFLDGMYGPAVHAQYVKAPPFGGPGVLGPPMQFHKTPRPDPHAGTVYGIFGVWFKTDAPTLANPGNAWMMSDDAGLYRARVRLTYILDPWTP
jgi:hypothetical protein